VQSSHLREVRCKAASVLRPGTPGPTTKSVAYEDASLRTPQSVVGLINRRVDELLATPEMKAVLQGQGAEPLPMSSQQISKMVNEDYVKWKGIVEASGATIE
jgi:hypothetical protein